MISNYEKIKIKIKFKLKCEILKLKIKANLFVFNWIFGDRNNLIKYSNSILLSNNINFK